MQAPETREVLVGATVLPMTRAGARAEAVAFGPEGIVAVGDRQAVLAAAGPDARVQELAGRAVLPGFVDPHHHVSLVLFYEGAVDCGPAVAPTLGAVLERVRSEAARRPPGAWLVGRGLDPWLLPERRFPTREELDEAGGGRPVFLLHFSYHQGVASTAALEAAGIDAGTPDPAGGYVARGPGGLPSGRLVEAGMFPVEKLARARRLEAAGEGPIARLLRYSTRLFEVGITRVADASAAPGVMELFRQGHAAGMKLPLVAMPTSGEGLLAPPWDRLAEAPTGEGTDALRVGSLKMWLDGGQHCALCLSVPEYLLTSVKGVGAMLRDRSLDAFRVGLDLRLRLGRDGRMHTGVLLFARDDARRIVRDAAERGFAVALHAVGNEAIGQALDAIGGARFAPGPTPPRVEHAWLPTREQVRRLADLGVCVVTQPVFLRLSAVTAAVTPPGIRFVPLRSMLDAGVRVAASSDAPVGEYDPLDAVRCAVARRDARGRSVHAEEAVTVEEALAMWTREAAHACGCLGVCGTLEPGKRADLVVLSQDPCGPGGERARVERTVLGGETVYEAPAKG